MIRSSSAIVAAILLIAATAIAITFAATRPATPTTILRGEIEQGIAALNGEYDSLNKIFAEPPGLTRDQAVDSLRVDEATMRRLVYDPKFPNASPYDEWSDGVRHGAELYGLSWSVHCAKLICDLKEAQASFLVVALDAQYVADHCSVPGLIAGAQNQMTCDRSFNQSDPRVLGATKDAIAFKAALEQANVDMDHYKAALDAPHDKVQPLETFQIH